MEGLDRVQLNADTDSERIVSPSDARDTPL